MEKVADVAALSSTTPEVFSKDGATMSMDFIANNFMFIPNIRGYTANGLQMLKIVKVTE